MANLFVTLWPDFPHFPQFAFDDRIAGIRLNSAAVFGAQIDSCLAKIDEVKPKIPLWFDVKGRQLRIEKVNFNPDYLDIVLNHPIEVPLPVPVLFKGGEDQALLVKIDGRRLRFAGGPKWMVREGDSIHIRHPALKIGKPLFTDFEKEKISKVRAFGFKKYFLSYVGSQYEVDEFLELVGRGSEVYLKIEDKAGLEFVNNFEKQDNLHLVGACGDLFVEVDRPHDIIPALELIIEKDPSALVGSRLLLSVIKKEENGTDKPTIKCNPVPSFSDFAQLAWLKKIGYRNVMLCDELCLREDLLSVAVGAFTEFFNDAR